MNKTMVCSIPMIVLAGVLALAPLVSAQTGQQQAVPLKEFTITGTVTCSKYVYSKPERKGFSPAEAIRLCISQGYSYVIVSGKDVYPLEGDRKQLAKLVGEKITITGHTDTSHLAPTYAYHDPLAATTIGPSKE